MFIGGYLYAAGLSVNIVTLIGSTIGTGLIIASGCVINNYIDRDIDLYMRRTKKRALVTGQISAQVALIYAVILGSTGLALLATYSNWLTVLVGMIGLFGYAFVYTLAKRLTRHATLIGTIPGSLPLVAGYTAVSGTLDANALILFLLMACWQMVHFYAIAIFRQKEYKKANIPVMPIVRGIGHTRAHMILFGVGFIAAVIALGLLGDATAGFVAIMVVLGIWWLKSIISKGGANNISWARAVFGRSLILLPTMCMLMGLNSWLP